MIRDKVGTITLHTFGPLNTAYTSCMAPFPTVLVLWNIQIHIGSANRNDKASYVEVSVDDFFGIWPILSIPNIDPDYSHIQLGRDLDDSRPGCKDNVIENVVRLEDLLNVLMQDEHIGLFIQVRDSYNFEVGFQLG